MRVAALLTIAMSLAACGHAADPTATSNATAHTCATPGDQRVVVKGGSFAMGDDRVYAEEGPVHAVRVDSFRIDPHEVTNRQFAKFVAATGYRTVAERPVDPALYPDATPAQLAPSSAVFMPPARPSNDYRDWWTLVLGANWKHPYGPRGPAARPNEPVVQVAYDDAVAYARWTGGRLPTEAEWEYAARAGAPSVSDQPTEANTWQGVFPVYNQKTDGFAGVSPVGCYRPNAYGLYDMIGNVWELTSDLYAPGHDPDAPARNPIGPDAGASFDPRNSRTLSRVIKGGSYLCAANYCRRYRAAARSPQDSGLGSSNVGFRTVAAAEAK